ncbi:MAG: hypothetical protein PUD65_06410 [Spirochaetales bacterium]|nr:hypothetical protein [Spirochaetales bacterium]
MNRKLFTAISIIITSLLLLCFVSCEENNAIPVGSLNISIDNTTRAIEPNISLDVSKYEVSLLNGDGTPIVSKEIDKSHTSLSQNNIPVGSYTVKVDAKNSEGVIIGTGSASCVIEKDKTTEVSVTVRELSGKGKLSITLTGGVDTSSSYTLTVYKPDDTEAGSVGFAAVDTSLKAELELDNGFYYFVVTDGEGNASTPEAFRIVNDDTLIAEAYIYESLGSFRVTITNSIKPNPTLSLSVSDSIIHVGEEFTVSATGMSGGSLAYSWYVNGKIVEGSESTLTLTLDFAGDYQIRCLVKDTASSVVWSSDKTITVHDAGYKPTELTLSGEIETWIIGDVLIPRDMVVTLNANGSALMEAQYGQGHRTFSLGDNSTLSCDLSGVEGYSYYFETEVAEDGSTIVYIVIDKEIDNPAYLSFIFDYDYRFNKERGEYRGFYVYPQGENTRSERAGIVSLTNNTTTRTIKVEPNSYRISSYTGSNCSIWSEMTPNNVSLAAGETKEVTVTIPYCRVKLMNFETESSSAMIISEQSGFDYIHFDKEGDEISFVLGNDYSGSHSFILREYYSDCVYRFEATITMGETIEVEPVRDDAVFVESDVTIPAGRALVKSTSSVLFENSVWPIYKVEDTAGNNRGTEDLDCRSDRWFNASTDMTISFADLLNTGYTFSVTVTPTDDENGAYSEVVVNVDKEIENYATLRITPDVDENLIGGEGALISLQMNGDRQLILLPYWASMEPYELKVAPGAYRCCGFWNSYRDPNTDIIYAPRVDSNFTCTSGETTDVTLYLEVWR